LLNLQEQTVFGRENNRLPPEFYAGTMGSIAAPHKKAPPFLKTGLLIYIALCR